MESCYFDFELLKPNVTFDRNVKYPIDSVVKGSDGLPYRFRPGWNAGEVQPPPHSDYWELVQQGTDNRARTTKQMMSKANFVGWDFNKVWKIEEGKTYPYFLKTDFVCKSVGLPL